MLQKSTWQHLRIPFSFYLLPVFVFACAAVKPSDWTKVVLVFFILHFLLYPASCGYNSWFDKDEKSIGGLEHPPKVTRELYWISLLFDVIAVIIGFFISWQFAVMLVIYGLASKAYSHPLTRWKRLPLTGWFVAGFFQGYFTFLMVLTGVAGLQPGELWTPALQWPALLTSALLWGSYPMTQVYQHEEDGRRGDETISRKLGISGTFHFTAICFLLSSTGFSWYFYCSFGLTTAIVFLVAMLPLLAFFIWWYVQVRKDISAANFKNTMRLNLYSAVCLNLFFGWLWIFGPIGQ